jgi:hypothetical protein
MRSALPRSVEGAFDCMDERGAKLWPDLVDRIKGRTSHREGMG